MPWSVFNATHDVSELSNNQKSRCNLCPLSVESGCGLGAVVWMQSHVPHKAEERDVAEERSNNLKHVSM